MTPESAVTTLEAPSRAELRVALAYTPAAHRPMLAALFAFDAMLGAFVARDAEPVLVQLRLAWWRDRLSGPAQASVSPDPLLSTLKASWAGEEAALGALVDAWEAGLGEDPDAGLHDLAAARSSALGTFAQRSGAGGERGRAEYVGRLWTLADSRSPDGVSGTGFPEGVLPRSRELRGLCVLGGLARRSLSTGRAMLGDRSAAVLALRLGLFGR